MKTLPLFIIVTALAAPLAAVGQTIVFSDNFANSSSLSPTAASPGIIGTNRTAYEIACTKSITPTISGNSLSIPFSTGSAYGEAQAQFTTNAAITLNTPGAYIELYYTFTDSPTMFNGNANAQEQLIIGLYNSGGSGPTNGTLLINGLASGSTTAVNGGTKNWLGYSANFTYNVTGTIYNNYIYTRVAQTGANNLNQGLGYSAGYALNTAGAQIQSYPGVNSAPALTLGNYYTVALQITYVNPTTLAITNTLYNGAGIGGSVVNVGGFNARFGGTATNANVLTTTFDSFVVGFRPTSSPTTGETLQITNITVLESIPTAPTITGLTNQTIVQGSNAVLSATVAGVPAPTLQWYYATSAGAASNAITGATSSSLTLNSVPYSQNGYVYYLVAANSQGTNSASMTLSVIVPPSITGLSSTASASVGDTVTFSPTVGGYPAPALQWQTTGANLADGLDANGSTISGSQTSTLTISGATAADSATYSLIASNSAGSVTNSVTLTVSSGNVLPSFAGPYNQTNLQGSTATFTVSSLSGVPSPTVQWLDQTQTPIPGATGDSLVLTNVQYSQNGYTYYLVASNIVSMVTNGATLTVIVPPGIATQPASLVVTNTQSASFTVVETNGEPPPTYQWYKNSSLISSSLNNTATNATLTIASAGPADAASYYVIISNSAGSTNSATVTLTVNSTMAALAFSPTNGATGICYDTPLTLTLNSTPTLGAAGTIKIFNITNSATPVDTISAASGAVQQRTFPGDGQSFSYKTIVISGSTVTIYPHFNVMTSNQTYYVTIDPGTFTDAAGANFAGISATNAWEFSTKAGGPVDANNPVVSADGSADFLTVQGAVNSIPSGNTTQRTINVRNGTYTEIVDVAGKSKITFRGQSRLGTLIGYPNNATFQIANSGTTHARMAFKVNANDIALDNLTITNMTPQTGSQAEALMIETSAQRCIVNNCDIVSLQDTILANVNSSQGYFYNSAVRGNYDYIWGGGNLYFNQCVMDTVAGVGPGGANLSAARTTTSATTSTNYPWANPGGTYTANGMSFVNCSFTAEAGAGTVTLTDGNGTAGELVSWYGCTFATNYISFSSSLFSGNYIFWQDLNTTNGVPVTYANVTSLSGSDARLLAATNIPTWFYGWQPQLAPNILTNPMSQTVNYGSPATFTVAATGIPDPTYQWQLNGTNLSSATSSSLTIASPTSNDAGPYTVIVTTPAGSVTSSTATLTVNPPLNTPPTFTAPITGSNFTINVGVNLAVSCTATDADLPAQTLTYSLLSGPTNSAVDPGTGNFTWRPTVSFAGTSNSVQVVVTDNGTPNLSATNNFNIVVNSLMAPVTSAPTYVGGLFSLTVTGQVGPDYALQATTNLVGGTWVDVATTNSPAAPFTLTDPNAASQPVQFYRIVTGPPLP